jgi:hypothetical protein
VTLLIGIPFLPDTKDRDITLWHLPALDHGDRNGFRFT